MTAVGPESGGRRIVVGVVGAPHGVKGEVRVKSFMELPTAIADHPLFTSAQGGPTLRMLSARALKDDMVVARLDGVTQREEAAALTGRQLFMDRSRLPTPEEDEFYHADLIGLPVRTSEGQPVGTVLAINDFGGGDLLEIAVTGGPSILVPFLRRFVPTVDVAGGVILVTPEALATEGEDEAAAEPGL